MKRGWSREKLARKASEGRHGKIRQEDVLRMECGKRQTQRIIFACAEALDLAPRILHTRELTRLIATLRGS